MKDLGWLVSFVAPMVIKGIEGIIEHMENPIAKKSLQIAIGEIKTAITILTDSDKDNAAQFAQHYAENWKGKVEDIVELVEIILEQTDNKEAKQKIADLKKSL